MSTTIDNKVVEMSFDNKNFEKNVNQSLGTLDKLKQSLNFNGAVKGFDELDSASKKLSFKNLSDSIENVKVQFSALEIAAITALTNITNRAVNAGINFAKSLSVDQITAGFGKYEQKTSAVQTIMSATAESWKKNADEIARTNYLTENGFFTEEVARNISKAYEAVASGDMTLAEASRNFNVYSKDVEDFTDALANMNHEGTQMEFIDDQLNKLNWFSDETSYSFSDMTSNIGKFTSNGVALTDAVEAMEGISVWAAKSGANVNDASRAMYNLSQAMAVGSVKLIDWKSIENANMATQEFKKNAIDTALAMGTLEETTEKGVYHVVGEVEEATVSVTNFNENLQKGWFTSDVLMSTLSNYGKATTLLSDIYSEYDTTATNFLSHLDDINDGTMTIEQASKELGIPVQELTKYVETLNSEEYQLGLTSFRMAQEAKTFTEAIEATKDAVSTGWMKTFEYIFGNYEEAKGFWTDIANGLWDVFAASGETRNAILKLWKDNGGRETFIKGFWDVWNALSTIAESIRKGFEQIFPNDVFAKSRSLLAITDRFRYLANEFLRLAERNGDSITRVFAGIASVLKIVKNTLSAVFKGFKQAFSQFGTAGKGILTLAADFGDLLVNISETAEKMGIFQKITEKVGKVVTTVGKIISNAVYGIVYAFSETGGKNPFEHFVNALQDLVTFTIPTTLISSIIKIIELITGKDLSEAEDKIFVFFRKFSTKVGEFIEYLKQVPSKLNGVFESITGMKVSDAFTKLSEKLTTAMDKIKEFFNGFKELDYKGIDEFSEKTEKKFEPLHSIFTGLGKAFEGLWAILKKTAPVFLALGSLIGEALGYLGDTISEKLSGLEINVESIASLLSSGGLLALGMGINKAFTKKKEGFGGLQDIIDSLLEPFDKLKEALESWQQSIKANTILKIAAAIGIVAVSLTLLAAIDSNKLGMALGVLSTAMVEIFGMFKLVSTANIGSSTNKAAMSMVLMAGSVLVLAFAMKKLSEIDSDKMGVAVLAITALLGEMTAVAKILGTSNKMMQGVGSLILLAIAVRMLVKPVAQLSEIEWDKLKQGLTAVGIILAELVAFIKILNASKFGIGTGIAIVLLASAMNLLIKPISILGAMKTEELIQGMIAFAATLGLIDIFANTLGKNSKRLISVGIGMVIVGAAMQILASAIEKLGSIPLDQLENGLMAVGVALLGIVMAINLLPKDAIFRAAGILVAAEAMTILSTAMKSFGEMSMEEIGRALLIMAGALLELGIALAFMQGTIAGSIALLIAASAIAVLAPSLKSLGKLSLKEIGTALLAMAGAFAVLGIAAALLTPVIPAMIGLAAAVALLGVAIGAIGVGVLALSAGLAALAVTGTAGIGVLVLAFEAIIGLVPSLIKAIGKGIIEIVKVIGDSIPIILETITKIIVAILDALIAAIPKIVDFLIVLLEELGRFLPTLIEFVLQFIVDLLSGIAEHIDEIVYQAVMIVAGVIDGLIRAIPDFIVTLADALGDAIPELLIRLGDSMVENAPKLRDSIIYLGKSIVKAFCEFFGINSPSTVFADFGVNLIQGLINGIKSLIETVKTTLGNMMTKMKEKITSKYTEWKNAGADLINKIKNGITEKVQNVKLAVSNMMTDAKNAVTNKVWEWYNVGADLINGFINGISDFAGNLIESVKGTVNNAIKAAKNLLGIKSPSRVFREIGINTDKGFIQGVDALAGDVAKSTADMGQQAIDAMQGTLNGMSDIFDETIDDPVIKPVLDLSEIQNGSGLINGLFSDQRMRLAYAADGLGFNRQPDPEEQRYTLQQAVSDAFKTYVPEIINAITASNSDQHFTFDLTPDTRRFYKEIRIQNHKFEREKGYNGLAD